MKLTIRIPSSIIFIFFHLMLSSQQKKFNIIYPNGGEKWETLEMPYIEWEYTDTKSGLLKLEYSVNSGVNWILIDSVEIGLHRYQWLVPNNISGHCLIKAKISGIEDVSDKEFSIIPKDEKRFRILVLGSSTAAGVGPSVVDSAWVWRYRNKLYQSDTRFEIINLAVGGLTTFEILQDSSAINNLFKRFPNKLKNIGRAFEYKPDAVIINLPSNDAAIHIPDSIQIKNFQSIEKYFRAHGIPLWICSPQPRNFNNDTIALQYQLSMEEYFFNSQFENKIDFWKGFGTQNKNGIDQHFDSGDGIHLNDKAHLILADRVLNSNIHLIIKNNNRIKNLYPQFKTEIHVLNNQVFIKSENFLKSIIISDQNGNQISDKKDILSNSCILELEGKKPDRYYAEIIDNHDNKVIRSFIKYN